jgi:hypothetical protein
MGVEVEVGTEVDVVPFAVAVAVVFEAEVIVASGAPGIEVTSPCVSPVFSVSSSDEVTGGGGTAGPEEEEDDWFESFWAEGINAEVLEVELKVEEEVEEDDDEACCKIRVRASSRLVKCTVVAKNHNPVERRPRKKKGKTRGGRGRLISFDYPFSNGLNCRDRAPYLPLSTASNSLRSPNLCVNSPGIESSVSSMSMTQRTSWSSLISVGMTGEGGAMMGYILGGMVGGRTGLLGHL